MSGITVTIIAFMGSAIGVLLTALRLPGTWLMVAAIAILGYAGGWVRVTVSTVLLLAGLAAIGEIFEFAASLITARRAGASRQAAWGGLIGGILGMMFLSLPFFLVGTFIGAILGCFLGAMIVELALNKRLGEGARVGFFSALGFAIGTATKIAVALIMSAIVVWTYWPTSAPVTPAG